MRPFYVYILASRRNGTLYVGMTEDMSRRWYEHQEGAFPRFTTKYGVKTLVWFDARNEGVELSCGSVDQGVAASVEDRADRGHEPGLGRPVLATDLRVSGGLTADLLAAPVVAHWVPAFAGIAGVRGPSAPLPPN